MLILIILLPLFSFILGCFFGKYIGKGICYLTTFGIFLSLLLSLQNFFFNIQTGGVFKIFLFPWISSDFLLINWSFCFDSLTLSMLVVVTFISLLVHLYSIEYMKEDPHLFRFMSYLSLFTFFMLVLITGNNFLVLFVGWEGVGLSSFLLINFWFTRIQANKSAIKAMFFNRIGDFFFLIALFSLYFICQSLDFDIIFSIVYLIKDYYIQVSFFKYNYLDLVCLFLFLGAMGKSAQIGLHAWLPDAMEGPTPVSALIHAATMVTAGVFLIIRCSFLIEYSCFTLNFILIVGSLTAFFAATVGLFQNDIKRVIAYSTCSQLGFMFLACGLSGYEVGFFHLFNHAFFKALLFMGAGSVIHALANEQDMRKMGGLRKLLPFSYSIMLIGSLALIGFPFLSGYFSKDVVLELAYIKYTNFSHFAYFLGIAAAFCTAFYSTRVLILVFLTDTNGIKSSILNVHEGSWFFYFPLMLLTILSITIGFLTKDLFIGFGTNFWENVIFILPNNYFLVDIEFLNLFIKLLPTFLTLIGCLTAITMYFFNIKKFYAIKQNQIFNNILNFVIKKWYFDKLILRFFGLPLFSISYTFCYKNVDRGILEKLGPHGITVFFKNITERLKNIQTGYVYHYLILLGFFFFFFVFFIYGLVLTKMSISLFIFILLIILYY